MSTTITYGNVTIGNVLTSVVEQVPQYDASGTDLQFWRYTVSVVGFLQSSYAPGGLNCQRSIVRDANGTDIGTNPAADAVTVQIGARSSLPPRRPFRMEVDGSVMLAVDPLSEGQALEPQTGRAGGLSRWDVDHGPKCPRFSVVQIAARNVFRVEATFEVCLVECDVNGSATGNTKGVLSHRWSSQDSMDVNKRVTRSYSGTLRTSGHVNPHMFRSMVVPPLQPFLRREQMQFVASEDGKSLQYSITDQEVAVGAPLPLTRWDIQHTESLDEAMAGRGELLVTMEGDSNADKSRMLEIGFWLLYGQLFRSTPRNAFQQGVEPTTILERISVVDYIGDAQRLSLQATVRRVPTAVDANGDLPVGSFRVNAIVPVTAARLPGFAGNPNDPTPGNDANAGNLYDRRKNPGNRYGETPFIEGPVQLVGLFVAYLQSPCSDDHKTVPDDYEIPANTNTATSNEPQVVPVIVVPSLPSGSTNPIASQSHQASMYTHYRMVSMPTETPMVSAMPIAQAPYTGGGVPGDATRIVNLAETQARRRVRIIAERIGEWPEMPDAATLPGFDGATGITQTLLKAKRSFENPDITAMGQTLYRTRFDAVYALSRAPQKSEPIPVGRSPWVATDYLDAISTNQTATDGWSQFNPDP